jgi:hypothetical protein
MSAIAIPSAVNSTLPAANVHPHGHGHKKGSEFDPTANSTSTTAAQIPVGSAQNLFGSLFSSLQQIVGGSPAAASPAASATNAAAGSTAAGSAAAAAASKINVMA